MQLSPRARSRAAFAASYGCKSITYSEFTGRAARSVSRFAQLSAPAELGGFGVDPHSGAVFDVLGYVDFHTGR